MKTPKEFSMAITEKPAWETLLHQFNTNWHQTEELSNIKPPNNYSSYQPSNCLQRNSIIQTTEYFLIN